ncbi:MAG: hypothetical protein ABW123_19645, partial [Cystobacter sp.]
MRPFSMKVVLCSLLSGVWGIACGGAALEPGTVDAPVVSQESALCGGMKVTSLTLDGASIYQGELGASGKWTTSAGATGVRLEYFIDGALYAAEEQPLPPGNPVPPGVWYLSRQGVSCDVLHPIQVKAFPMVVDSNNRRVTCMDVAGSKTVAKYNLGVSCTGNTSCDTCHMSAGRVSPSAAHARPHDVLHGSG